MPISPDEKAQLEKLMQQNEEAEDNTAFLRKNKKSHVLRSEILNIEYLKKKYNRLMKSNPTSFEAICNRDCSFLADSYPMLFKKLVAGELDLTIMNSVIQILEKIENGELEHQEGSLELGKLLFKTFVPKDLETTSENPKNRQISNPKKISYADFKNSYKH